MLTRLTNTPLAFTADQIKAEKMLFSADEDFAFWNGGPITRSILSRITLDLPLSGVVIDTRVHMLKPGWVPAIGGWHCDAIPRGKDGQPDFDHPAIPSIEHYLCVIDDGSGSLTEFAEFEGTPDFPKVAPKGENVWGVHSKMISSGRVPYRPVTAKSGHIYRFGTSDYHRAIPATGHGWRFFFRASVNTLTKGPLNEIRQQVQVYLPDAEMGW